MGVLRATVPVPRLWPGATIVCIATGPSLVPEDLDAVRTAMLPALVINDAIFSAPWASIHYAPDARWWAWNGKRAECYPAAAYTLRPDVADQFSHVAVLKFCHQPGMATDPSTLHTGGHAGYQAINLAVHLVGPGGRIVLLGYDMQLGANGESHSFGEHPDGSHVRFDQWLSAYDSLMADARNRNITLINATRETAITAIPRQSLAQVLGT